MGKVCQKCGNRMKDIDIFCTECGTKYEKQMGTNQKECKNFYNPRNFDINHALAIPFSIKQELPEKSFLVWSHEKQEVPFDIMLNSQLLEIKKVYFPIRHFHNMNYTAEWKAKSFWEHLESYIVYESKIVYVDIYGREHDSMVGAKNKSITEDDFVPQAVSKMNPVTKYKPVIDKTEWTTGRVEGISSSSYVDYNPDREDKFKDWIREIIKSHSKEWKQYKNIEDCMVFDLYGSNEDAFSSVRSALYSKAEALGEEQIPGTRYTDFEILKFDCDYMVDVILSPVFQVKYSYRNQRYDYYVDGTNVDNVYVENYPIDEDYVAVNNRLTNEIAKEENSESFYLMLILIFSVLFVISGIGLYFFGIGLTLFLISIIGGIVSLIFYKKVKGKVQFLHKELDNLNLNRLNARRDFNQKNNIGSYEKKNEL